MLDGTPPPAETRDLKVFPATEGEFRDIFGGICLVEEDLPNLASWHIAARLLSPGTALSADGSSTSTPAVLHYEQVRALGPENMPMTESLVGVGGAIGILESALGKLNGIRSFTLSEITRVLAAKGLKIVPDVPPMHTDSVQ